MGGAGGVSGGSLAFDEGGAGGPLWSLWSSVTRAKGLLEDIILWLVRGWLLGKGATETLEKQCGAVRGRQWRMRIFRRDSGHNTEGVKKNGAALFVMPATRSNAARVTLPRWDIDKKSSVRYRQKHKENKGRGALAEQVELRLFFK